MERFVRFRLNVKADADDVLQEVFFAAYKKFPQLKNKNAFKAWIISIARSKCNDYFRKKATRHEIPIDEITASELSDSRYGVSLATTVRETLDLLCDKNKQILFLDGDEFMLNWGFGEDNCGNETHLSVKGDIQRVGNSVTSADKDFLLDIVGRYTVTIGGKTYDTVCVMDIETYNCGVVSEQFLDKDGKTILWRRYNRDDWAINQYNNPWSEQLPENDRLIINGSTYVHWYDCITDHIL